jgi:hypothetical protein
MAKGSFAKDVSRFVKGLSSKLTAKALDSIAREMAHLALDLIRRRTRSGKGVKVDGGQASPLKRLSPRYIDYRRANSSKLSAFTSPGRSNLTFTGEMLNSMSVLKKSGGGYLIGFKGRRNERVAERVSNVRPFLNLSADEQERLAKALRRSFDRHMQQR